MGDNREFKGVWIPAEIWLTKSLTVMEKILLAEIDSFSNNELGCIAKNEYFAEFLGIKEAMVKRYLGNLKKLELIEQVSFDGRRRELKSNLKNIEKLLKKSASYKSSCLKATKVSDRGLLSSSPILYNSIYNRREDIEEDKKSSSKESKDSLKSPNNKKEINNFPIEKDLEFKEILDLWNSFPLATKHLSPDTKTVAEAFAWFQRLKDGSFCRYASAITADWLVGIGAPLNIQSKKFSFKEVKEGVRRIGLQWQQGYWPHTIEEKKKYLPKSLPASFYSPYNKGCPSVFLKVFIKEPISNGELSTEDNDKYGKYFQIYADALTLDKQDKNRLVKYIKNILDIHRKACNVEIKCGEETFPRYFIEESLGTNFVENIGDINHPEYLFSSHADFIYECKMEWKNFKLNSISFSPHGKLWDHFLTWLEEKKNTKLWLEDDEEDYLGVRYNNYKRENDKTNDSKNIKVKIKELEKARDKTTSEDVKMLFDEDIERLKGQLKKKDAV